MTEDLKFLMQRVVSRKFHNVKVNDEILAGVNHVCNLVIHSILYYSFPVRFCGVYRPAFFEVNYVYIYRAALKNSSL